MAELDAVTRKVMEQAKVKFELELASYIEEKKVWLEIEKAKVKVELTEQMVRQHAEAEQSHSIHIHNVRLKTRDAKLATKQAILSQYSNDVLQGLMSLSATELVALIMSVLSNLPQEKQDKAVVKFGELSHQLLGNRMLPFTVADSIVKKEAGFIIEVEDVEYDYLFVDLLKDHQTMLNKIIIGQVFNHAEER